MVDGPRIELTSHDDGVRVLRLVDPGRRNALGRVLRDRLTESVAELAGDDEARALVVTGAGPGFCGGADLAELFGPPGRPVTDVRADLMTTYASFLGIRDLPFPTIAAVHGAAVGAGVNLALACDLTIMGPAAFLDISFTRIGLHPGGGCTAFLVEALGRRRALEIILRARRLDADECVRLGLALEVSDDPESAALELARTIAGRDAELVRDVLTTTATATTADFATTLELEAWVQAISLGRSPEVLAPRGRGPRPAPASSG